jgi:hypothetical protein
MRTLLRNRKTGFYFEGLENWASSAESAFDFKITERAIRFVRDAKLNTSELELILAFDNPNYNISLPIDERFGIYASASAVEGARDFWMT